MGGSEPDSPPGRLCHYCCCLAIRSNFNPIEHVWGEVKGSISNKQRANFDEARESFEGFIQVGKFQYRLERF